MAKVNRSVARDPGLRLQNLQLLVTRIKHFYLTTLQQLIITSLPNISVISHSPDLGELQESLSLLDSYRGISLSWLSLKISMGSDF